MSEHRKATCVFIGETSLLLRCCEMALIAGHTVVAVVTTDASVADGARGQGIEVFETAGALSTIAYEYLFSAGNLTKIDMAIVRRAGAHAINFHDGPLPRFAGLNAPVWALMAGEPRYAITWHEMTDKIDHGRIAVQTWFDIAVDETAATLNAKCYDTGTAAFGELLRMIENGNIPFQEQTGVRSYFGRFHRPPVGGRIDMRQSAVALVRLVRSLDFGAYDNPIGRPFFEVNGRRISASSARAIQGVAAASIGTITSVADARVTIATVDGSIELGGLRDGQGQPLNIGAAGLAIGQSVAEPTSREIERQLALDRAVVASEPAWITTLRNVSAASIGYPRITRSTETTAAKRHVVSLDPASLRDGSLETLIAGLMTWAAMQSDAAAISMRVQWPDDVDLHGEWLAKERLLTVPIDKRESLSQLVHRVDAAIVLVRARAPMTADLSLRRSRPGLHLPRMDDVPLAVCINAIRPSELVGAELILAFDSAAGMATLSVDARAYSALTAERMAAHLSRVCELAIREGGTPLYRVTLLSKVEMRAASDRSERARRDTQVVDVWTEFSRVAHSAPDRIAVRHRDAVLTYADLHRRAGSLAARLRSVGTGPGSVVGVSLERGVDLVAAILAVLATGAAYLPLDPHFPADRLEFMTKDAGVSIVVAAHGTVLDHRAGIATISFDDKEIVGNFSGEPRVAGDLAYILYTSGSTGRPKGVMISVENLANFLSGMDEFIETPEQCVWLALTSISFDISILELLWTVTRGATIVVPSAHGAITGGAAGAGPSLSLFYFAASEQVNKDDGYRLLFEGARFADANGFEAVWTPERHFHGFGGPYPNPAVTSAALAGMTQRVSLRAGSCVAPLHHPLRIAEDWAVVDQISRGRAGIALASGWSQRDFVLAPQNYADRKAVMLDTLDKVRRLWRGETVMFPDPKGNVEIKTHPLPYQTEIPIWLTAARAPETFEAAGRLGCNVLTHLLGMTFDDIASNVRLYRDARRAAGFAGPGRVTLMLHTFVAETDDAAREINGPAENYTLDV